MSELKRSIIRENINFFKLQYTLIQLNLIDSVSILVPKTFSN